MGWWDTGIMGGDTPYDFAGLFTDLIKPDLPPEDDGEPWGRMHIPDDWFPEEQAKLKEAFEKYGVLRLIEHINKVEKYKEYREVAFQVLAFLCVHCGVDLRPDYIATFVKACEEDEWAQDDEGRKEEMDHFISILKSYTGKPVIVETKGLFERMGELFE